MSEKKLIDWLLHEDVLNLKEGLRPETIETADTLPADLTFSEAAPAAETLPENSIAAAQKKQRRSAAKKPIFIAIAALAVVGLAGAGFWLSGGLSGGDNAGEALTPASVEPTTTPTAPAALTHAADAATIANAVTLASLAATEITTAALPATAALAISATAPALQPTAATKATAAPTAAAPITTPAPTASGVVAPSSVQIMVIAGPLKSSKLPAEVKTQGYATQLTYTTIKTPGREVVALQPVAEEIAAKAEAALAEKGYKVKTEVSDAGKLLRAGPFTDIKQADDAAVILVLNQIPAKAQDVLIASKIPYLNAGPFADEYAADQARAWLAQALAVETWRIEKQ